MIVLRSAMLLSRDLIILLMLERGPDFCCSRRRAVTGEERSRGDLVSPEKKIDKTGEEEDSRNGPVVVNAVLAAITPPPVAGLLAAAASVAACRRRRGVAAAITSVAVPLTWKKILVPCSVAEQNVEEEEEAKNFGIQIFGDSSSGQRKKIKEDKKQQRRKEEKAYLEEMVADWRETLGAEEEKQPERDCVAGEKLSRESHAFGMIHA
ncbi:hypothetical protein MRB53_030183 [Persea americana]|uniref:Uncharacterized protein n=1 Tax=Persea americana TaxID=3435 RepID=A0ACC2KKJ7_PERAE|nr:hypothetical protein MRB53_030183 [Persea americana]